MGEIDQKSQESGGGGCIRFCMYPLLINMCMHMKETLVGISPLHAYFHLSLRWTFVLFRRIALFLCHFF